MIGYTLSPDAAHHLSLAKPLSRDSLVGQLQTVFMQKRLFMCSERLSGSQTCGILLFRTRAESSFGEQKVKDSDRLELDWLLKCKLEELIASVRPMSANRSYPLPQRAFQHLVAILRDPDDVIPMAKNRVTPACVAHRLTP